MEIEKLFRCRLSIDAGYDDLQKISNKAFLWETKGMRLEFFSGNAACFPYAEMECESEKALTLWRDKLIRYINRFKDAKVNP